MAIASTEQLALQFADEQASAHCFVPTRPLSNHRLVNSALRKLNYVRRFFPEFVGKPIRVGLTRAASGMAVPGGQELWVNPAHLTYHTIAHEFVHLLQGSGGIPGGERSCDLFSLARHWTLNDTPPFYLRVPSEFVDLNGSFPPEKAKAVYEVARRAIELRRAGVRHYIAYFETTLSGRDLPVRMSPRSY